MDETQLDLFADLPPTFAAATPLPRRPTAPPPRRITAPSAAVQDALLDTPTPPKPTPAQGKRRPRRKLGFHRAADAASDMAEACVTAWHGHHGGGRIEIPVGIVASLALLPFRGDDLVGLEDWILGLDDQQLWKLYEEVWANRWMQAPHLIGRCGIIADWLQDDKPDKNLRAAVRAVTERAIQYGVLELAADDGHWALEVDLMSWMVTLLRSRGARDGLGEFHTPADVSDTIAGMLLGDAAARWALDAGGEIRTGMRFLDPACGTGGLFRSAALALRDMGHDPTEMLWVMVDIDAIAVACASVNALLWGLGSNVAVIRGDSLAEGDIGDRAIREAVEMVEHRDRLHGSAVMIAAIRRAERMLSADVAA